MNDEAVPILIEHLHRRAAQRPAGYVEEVMSLAVSRDGQYVYLRKSDWAILRQKYYIPPKRLPPPMRVPFAIPEDFDPEQERRRMKQGGCCGAPSA